MNQVRTQNNSGLFRSRKSPSKKKRHGRLFIRRSKIEHNSTYNYPQEENFTINYRPQWRHRRIRRRLLNGGGDEQISTPSSSISQKPMDFTELQQIFDNAVRNRLSIELHKEKPQSKDVILIPHENLRLASTVELQPTIDHPMDTRINFSASETNDEQRRCSPIAHVKEHKILSILTCVTFSAFLGFFSVFIFVKPPL